MAIKYFILHIYIWAREVILWSGFKFNFARTNSTNFIWKFLKILMSMCEVWQLVIQQYVYKDVSFKPDMGHRLHQSNNIKS